MGGLWHQSIKVTAKMMPCHSWRALKLMSVTGFWWALEGLCSPPWAPLLPVLADEECSDRKSCRRRKEIKSDISAPSPDLVRIVLFCPKPIYRTSCSLFLSFFVSLSRSHSYRLLRLAVKRLPFISSLYGGVHVCKLAWMWVPAIFYTFSTPLSL